MYARRQTWGTVFALLSIGAGLFIREPLLNSPPKEYWTVRQYPSLLKARAIYRLMAMDNQTRTRPVETPSLSKANHIHLVEPPVRELLAARIYKVRGKEEYWPLQAMSLAAWGIGAFFLYLLCSFWRGPVMGCAAVAFFMFFPYGHLASIGIMPDVPMTGLLIAGMWSIHWYGLKRSAYRFVVSALTCSLTVFLKPGVPQFAVVLAFSFSAWSNAGAACFKDGRNYAWGLLALGPAVVWLTMNVILGDGWFERALVEGGPWINPQPGPIIDGFHPILNIKPSYLLTLRFWRAWLGNLVTMFEPWGVCAGLAGLALLVGGKNKPVVLFGWIAGYLAQCCLTTWTTMAHDYWHLQAVPLAAIGVGALANAVYGTAKNEVSRKTLVSMAGAGMLGALLMAHEGRQETQSLDGDLWYENACCEIGTIVDHSPHCLFMDWDSGWSLRYFADIGGSLWPDTDQLDRFRRDGLPLLADWEQKTLKHRMGELAERQNAAFDYFICMRKLEDLDNQPDLRAYLADKPMVVQGPRYCVWDLREANKPVSTPFKKSPKTNHDQLSGISHPANSEDNLR